MVLAENEEESPWEPLHVERGFKKEDSTVTLFFPNSLNWVIPSGVGAKGILEPMANSGRSRGLICYMIPPGAARVMAHEGLTKEKIKKYIAERMPASPGPGGSQNWPSKPLEWIVEGMMIVIAGGPGGMGITSGARINGQNFVTEKIELPSEWGNLVTKYKNLVPTYEKY
jgi:hypothetical protein